MRSRARAACARARREEAGFTLVELLVASGLLLVVLAAVLALLESSNGIAARDQERTHAIRDAQVGVYAMTKELRQAFSIVSSSPYLIEVHVWKDGADHDVTYDCTGTSSAGPPLGQCVRYETTGSGQGAASVVVDRLINKSGSGRPPVFTYSANGSGHTTYATVHVEAPSKGERAQGYGYRVTFDDGFFMRNLNG
jgi:prepilin-type N-terminal cleavage/methylation domain-containing protein